MSSQVIIGIPNWNGKDVLGECLDSIYRSTEYENYSVTVVDNGSTDGSVEMIKADYPQVTLIENNENRGASKAFNQVIDQALSNNADYIFLMNSDIEVIEIGWLSTLVEIAENGDIGIIGCNNKEPDGSSGFNGDNIPLTFHSLLSSFNSKYDYNKYNQDSPDDQVEYYDVVQGSAFLLKSELIRKVGEFDEGYSPVYFEDYDLCMRAWMNGFRVAYTPDVSMVHIGQESDLGETLRLYYMKRHELRFMLTYYPLPWLIIAALGFFFPPVGMEGFFLKFDEGKVGFREDFIENPSRSILLFISVFVYNIVRLQDIYSKRRDREDIRSILK